MIRRKTEKTTRNKTKGKNYAVDGKKYQSKTLYETHLEFKEALNKGFIKSFDLDSGTISRKSRYTSYKPVIDEIKFDSLMEGRYYIYLKELEQKNQISFLELQPSYELQPSFKKGDKRFRAITYIADFTFLDSNNKRHVVDVKGKETVEFKIKQKLFEYKYPELTLSVIQFYDEQWMELSDIKKLKRKKTK